LIVKTPQAAICPCKKTRIARRHAMRALFRAGGKTMTRSHAVVLLLSAAALSARAADDQAALQGIKDGKIVYDITEGDGKLLLERIDTVDETRQALIKQGVTPHFVLSFRGGATRLVQTDMEKVKPEDRPYATKIQAALAQLSKAPGMDAIEQCAVAIRHVGTKAENVIPPVKVVGNSYVSLMAYQSRGYAYIRP
jgi:intracellular sulfur oxidation DsrE/DsrF family protein